MEGQDKESREFLERNETLQAILENIELKKQELDKPETKYLVEYWERFRKLIEEKAAAVLGHNEEAAGEAYTNINSSKLYSKDIEALSDWLALVLADIEVAKKISYVNGAKLSSSQPFSEEEIRGGNVAINFHVLAREDVRAVEKMMAALGVNPKTDELKMADPEMEAYFGNIGSKDNKECLRVMGTKPQTEKMIERGVPGISRNGIEDLIDSGKRKYFRTNAGMVLEVFFERDYGRSIGGFYCLPERAQEFLDHKEEYAERQKAAEEK